MPQKYSRAKSQKNIFNKRGDFLNEWGGFFNEWFFRKNNFQKKFLELKKVVSLRRVITPLPVRTARKG